ncbi:MAG: hypothetical protein J0H14_03825 [Alphaproteobacteria bacterium]|nr:hypothetical protein [Alphaproteobacteria bacterium]
MLGIVPLVNVPFDWASIGFTRALLRRGCDPRPPSPLLLGLADLAIGLVLLVLLALALIAALQLADAVLLCAGGEPLAHVGALLDNIARDPRDPANYWAYATLFSTLIPSALNAAIGSMSLGAWLCPPLRHWASEQMALLDEPGRDGTRARLAAYLAAQVAFGVGLTILALWLFWEALLEAPYVLPVALHLFQAFAAWLAP